MKLVFAGTPDAAVPALRALAAEHEVAAVITRRDAEVGRKRVRTPSSVAQAAGQVVPTAELITANRLDDEVTAAVAACQPELGVIVAYGGLVREPLLSLPTHGWINLHFSLLPSWRGAAPVQRAIMAGDSESGVSVFQLGADLDTGDVFAVEPRPIGADETAGDLLEALAASGAQVLVDVVRAIAAGTAHPEPQRGEPSYAAKVEPVDGALDLTRPAEQVYARLRGVTPAPGAYVVLNGERFKIPAARLAPGNGRLAPGHFRSLGRAVLLGTASDPLELLTVQPFGKRAMDARDWWRGVADAGALVAS